MLKVYVHDTTDKLIKGVQSHVPPDFIAVPAIIVANVKKSLQLSHVVNDIFPTVKRVIVEYTTSLINNPEFREDMLNAHEEAVKSIDLSIGIHLLQQGFDETKKIINRIARDAKKQYHFHRIKMAMKAAEVAELQGLNQHQLINQKAA